MKLARMLVRSGAARLPAGALAVAVPLLACAVARPPADPSVEGSRMLRVRLPDLSSPLVDVFPRPDAAPADPVKAAVLERINYDREAAGRQPVAWDEGASRVADAFCRRQVLEATTGHFLTDGIPPYARTAFAGVFGAQSENSVSWITTGHSFHETAERLAILGHEGMMSEKPPADGHRRTILDPEATHVGVGYALEAGRFQMAQEFLTRGLDRLVVSLREPSHLVLRFDGRSRENSKLEFVTIAHEPTPSRLTREQASGRVTYSYPEVSLAYVAEGSTGVRVSGTDTQQRIRMSSHREFSFQFVPERPGLYTFVFYMAARASNPARPGGSATIWVE